MTLSFLLKTLPTPILQKTKYKNTPKLLISIKRNIRCWVIFLAQPRHCQMTFFNHLTCLVRFLESKFVWQFFSQFPSWKVHNDRNFSSQGYSWVSGGQSDSTQGSCCLLKEAIISPQCIFSFCKDALRPVTTDAGPRVENPGFSFSVTLH